MPLSTTPVVTLTLKKVTAAGTPSVASLIVERTGDNSIVFIDNVGQKLSIKECPRLRKLFDQLNALV